MEDENALINRTNLVRKFISEINNLSVEMNADTKKVIMYNPTKTIEIIRLMETNEFQFSMNLLFEFLEEQNSPNSQSGYIKTPIVQNAMVHIMSYKNGEFKIINAGSNNSWIRHSFIQTQQPNGIIRNTKKFLTTLNMGYKVLPDSEESHFQHMTTDGLVLELEECIAIHKMIQTLKEYGSVVQATPDIKALMFF